MDSTLMPARTGYRLRIKFVGSGSEYFRIWIVNTLLTIVTLGIYLPYAKVRRLRYFYGNTEISGRPLAYQAEPRRMLGGYALMAVLAVVYSVAVRSSAPAALVALVAMGALWPALWRSSLRFRLANTTWCGLTAGFEGSTANAYRAMLPALAAVLLMALPDAVGAARAAQEDPALTAAAGIGMLLALVLVPTAAWSMRRYQHGHLRFANEQARFNVPLRDVYGVFGAAFGLLLVLGLGFGGLAALLVRGGRDGPSSLSGVGVALGALVMLLGVIAVQAVLWPFVSARLQNLYWNGTRSLNLRVKSRLKARELMLLSLKNWVLMVVTFGLYTPFAAVATARLRLESVKLVSAIGARELLGGPPPARVGAAGDAASELFGVDIGL